MPSGLFGGMPWRAMGYDSLANVMTMESAPKLSSLAMVSDQAAALRRSLLCTSVAVLLASDTVCLVRHATIITTKMMVMMTNMMMAIPLSLWLFITCYDVWIAMDDSSSGSALSEEVERRSRRSASSTASTISFRVLDSKSPNFVLK